jgi:DNA (cytosine-5)-methyltransferase 1
MKVAGLFAGIGGLENGLAQARHETVFLCENWEPAREVLATHLPTVPLEGDVREVKALPGETEALSAGFPCQDLSQAGLTAGIGGKRSGLVGEVFRLLDGQALPWVILENVSFMLRLDRGRAMRTLVEAFEERGYRWAYRVVNSQSFLPQRRERVLIVATKTDIDPASVLLTDEAEPKLPPTNLNVRAHGFYWTEGLRGLGWAPDAVPTLKNGSTVGIASPPAILLPSGEVITPDIRDAERLQGFPIDWTAPAAQAGRASLRWSLVGNAVTVPVAKWLGTRLNNPSIYEAVRDCDIAATQRWPSAARFDGSKRHAVEINAYPTWESRPPLVDFLQFDGKPLSSRATRGFLSRTERAKLRFPDGFQDRLREHLFNMEADAFGTNPRFAVAAE